MSAAVAIRTTTSCCAIGQTGNDPPMPEPTFEELIDAMRDAVAVLQRAEIPFVLGGGLSAWARGGPRALVDLIYNPASGPITDEQIERAPLAEVMAVRIHVSTLEDVMVAKLMAMTEQEPDFGALLEWTRALREQIDWTEVRTRTEASPFARAFFTLVEGLGVVEAA